MPTINQLVRQKKRVSKKINLKKTPALGGNPQKHGTCISVFTKTPRKPNSALRKVAKVRLVNSRIITVYIPGEGHNISRFSDVLISGRRIRDLPGVKYGALRGKFDLSDVKDKRNGRSKYGRSKDKESFVELKKRERSRNFKNRFYYKSFCKMYLNYLVGDLKMTSDRKRYWLKAHFYFNLLLLNTKSIGFDFRGHFHQKFKGLLTYLYNYKEYHKRKYGNKYPYKIVFVNRKVLVVKDLRDEKIYKYDLKKI
jgi:small subunit ribosomal protein S12